MGKKLFLQLPEVILIEILSRLPLRSICTCKCVCKPLLYLITFKNQELGKLHLSRSHPEELIFQFRDKFKASNTLYLLNDQKLVQPTIQDLQIKTKFCVYSSHIVKNSCCGLLYLIDTCGIRSSIVTNPITGEYIVLPREMKHASNLASWLGFCPKTNQFKVLRIFYPSFGVVATQIYELGSDSWRDIEAARFCPQSQVVHSINGTLYWECYDRIHFFCFEKEKFGNIPFPIGYGKYQNGLSYYMNVGMLKDCLSLCDISSTDHHQHMFNAWEMKEYGGRKTWSEKYVIDIGTIAKSLQHGRVKFRIVKHLSNGELLMMPEDESKLLCLLDPMHKTIRCLKLEYNGLLKEAKCRLIVYSPSLVSLKDVIKHGNVNILTVKSRDIEFSASCESENLNIVEYYRFESVVNQDQVNYQRGETKLMAQKRSDVG